MIEGTFDADGSPYVFAGLVIPALNLYLHGGSIVRFLVDTGASSTCLHPEDARRLGIPIDGLQASVWSRGIGGRAGYAAMPAQVYFQEPYRFGRRFRLVGYDIDLAVALPTEENAILPSLLGRDILNQWNIRYDQRRSLLNCRPHTFDQIVS